MNKKVFSWAAAAMVAASSLAGSAMAAGFEGTIISRTAVVGPVTVPQRECVEQEQVVRQPQTGAGALLGALVGGGVGHAIGGGAGRAAATGLGAVAGALAGDRLEADATPATVTPVDSCRTVGRVENRVIGYDVVYAYDGQRYSARLQDDPGEPGARLALNVSVTPVAAAAPPPDLPLPAAIYAPPVVAAPVVVGPVAPSFGVTVGPEWRGHRWH